jgi:hypothetical protein
MPEAKYLSTSTVKAIVSWDLNADEIGSIHNLDKVKPLSVTVTGDFGGSTLVIEGNNAFNEVMVPLNDPNGYPLTFNTNKIEAILEDCARIRPRVIGGNESTNLIVNLLITPLK